MHSSHVHMTPAAGVLEVFSDTSFAEFMHAHAPVHMGLRCDVLMYMLQRSGVVGHAQHQGKTGSTVALYSSDSELRALAEAACEALCMAS